MTGRSKKLQPDTEKEMVFIIGTGRSGTHFLAGIFDSKDFELRVEKQPTFGMIVDLATGEFDEGKYQKLVEYFRKIDTQKKKIKK